MNVKLGEVAKMHTGYSFRSKISEDSKGNTHVVQIKDISASSTITTDSLIKTNICNLKDHYKVQSGDILFQSVGVANSVALAKGINTQTVASSQIICIRVDQSVLVPSYLVWLLCTYSERGVFESMATGTSLKRISKQQLDELEIDLPSLHKQSLIAEIAMLSDKEQALISELAEKRKKLIGGVLSKHAKDS